jgi:hypothetical protein
MCHNIPAFQEPKDHGGGNIKGKICNHLQFFAHIVGQNLKVNVQGITAHDGQRGHSFSPLLEIFGHLLINLHGYYPLYQRDHEEGQYPHAWTDLHYAILRFQRGQTDDLLGYSLINEEVLAEGLFGENPSLL